jgi:hypothetical protein
MKTTIGIILGVILGLIIITIVSVWLVFSVFSSDTQPNTGNSPTIVSPPPTTKVEPDFPSNPISPSIITPSPPGSTVNYSVNITGFQVSGLSSGTVVAQISNTGTGDSHNVWAKVEIIYQGSIVRIAGQDSLRKDIGTVKAGGTITTEATINLGLTDGIKISQNGATIRLTIYSDEKTETLSYDFQP